MRQEPRPDFQKCFVDVDVFALDTELEVCCLRVVKLFLQGLSHSQEVMVLWRDKNTNMEAGSNEGH